MDAQLVIILKKTCFFQVSHMKNVIKAGFNSSFLHFCKFVLYFNWTVLWN